MTLLHPISDTHSVCPVCVKTLAARRVRRSGGVFLERECPEHGAFSTLIWRDRVDFEAWTKNAPRCPTECAAGTCCVVLEVTKRCNLSCRYCFADGGTEEPSLEEVLARIGSFVEPGQTLLQLSGGEPTLRDDLAEIIRAAKGLGCKYVQLNSNGLRLANDAGYARALADAGLSFVFLQFDGTRDDIYEKLRGAPLLEIKKRAIANCSDVNIGVTLVPTIVRGVNDDDLGEILRLAVALSPAVRGVHFQPVGYLGRVPAVPSDDDRFTLDELIDALTEQSQGLLKVENLRPSSCDHPLCGFHGDFIVRKGGELLPLSGCGGDGHGETDRVGMAAKNREFVGRRWQRPKVTPCCEGMTVVESDDDLEDMDAFLARARTHGFTVTAMAFQDVWNLDLERIRSCSLHVFSGGALKPFCAHYIRHA